jgi:class 3 adenylate cyclase
VRGVPLLLVQPALWAVAAGVTGTLRRTVGPTRRGITGIGIAAVMAVLLGGASIAAMTLFGGPVPRALMAGGIVTGAVLAVVFVAANEWVFTQRVTLTHDDVSNVRTEDADVDELLRVIASAEEALEDRHAIDATVLITDMKGFSKLTQEQGTFSTAKLIQKHRDLLLPIIRECGGRGKSTGGDGLVAAFSAPDDALAAAARMQQTLKTYNNGKPAERQVVVRTGVAHGDIIVDRSGAPFIGDALNLAARVMGLADGGQVFATHEVVDQAAKLPSPVVSHGDFDLKNISRPVNIYEVLWDEGQQPRRPEAGEGAVA